MKECPKCLCLHDHNDECPSYKPFQDTKLPPLPELIERLKQAIKGAEIQVKMDTFEDSGVAWNRWVEKMEEVIPNGILIEYLRAISPQNISTLIAALEEKEREAGDAYGRGVTAGKKEALGYKDSERANYIAHAALGDEYADLRATIEQIQEREGKMREALVKLEDQAAVYLYAMPEGYNQAVLEAREVLRLASSTSTTEEGK